MSGELAPPTNSLSVDRAFVCDDCGHCWYYDRHRCSECAGQSFSTYELDTGEVIAKTTVEMTPPDIRSPNYLGLARFDGVQVIAQLADDAVSVGDTVEFAGEHQLRAEQRTEKPRLTAVEGQAD
ncbi:Zn-ribbon domain-containing OB-fold protein [Natrinema salinisoli]|uniref:Zn-ribbon domain-containing OB-fold protein n=1 Tax=Natrinema salinisoli TaxID=2878535 RepID=UPI001CF01355|nr:hypothetical protein [Natrinema salinisoli]